MERAVSVRDRPEPNPGTTLVLGRLRYRQAVIVALAIAQGRRAETAVALGGIDPREAADRILRALAASN